jgi:predicted nucleotidyltransferase
MSFGLRPDDLTYIISSISKFSEIEKASVFGSRAKGNSKHGSDVDIAIYGDKITFDTVSRLHAILEEESPMPYYFDVVDFSHVNHESLKEHINRAGKVIYTKDK